MAGHRALLAVEPDTQLIDGAEITALEQTAPGLRAQIAREYDAYLADFAIGDYGRAEVGDDERRNVARTVARCCPQARARAALPA
jgi:hypothetical protein